MGLEVLFGKFGCTFKKNEFMCREKDEGDHMFLILEGKALIFKEGRPPKRERKVIAQIASGDFFGEMSVLEGLPRFAHVIALTDVKALKVNHDLLEKVVKLSPDFALSMLEKLAQRLRSTSVYKR